ncbi:MAG: ornithine carbamoyltransferase [Endomicrobium sp.]|jgi:ornithine carbamoyltransferase|nr:ornithine carbamoyltransferase [Endomicrobium sp.]
MKTKAKHLLSIDDLSKQNIYELIYKAFELKSNKTKYANACNGKTLGLIFNKPSTRTIVSFAVAMIQLSGSPIILNTDNLQLKYGESIHDTAIILSQYLNGIVIRTFHHKNIKYFAEYASIPIINGLTNKEHPCQILSDIMTVMELYNITFEALNTLKIVYIGDSSNNIACSLLKLTSILGLNLTIISPQEYSPKLNVLNNCLQSSLLSKAKINVTSNINLVKDADVVYTDVWTSMGFEKEKNIRRHLLAPYQVNSSLLKTVAKSCIVLHCLPAVQGEEITSDVMAKYKYSIFKQSENKLYMQKAILLFLIKN